MEYTTLGLLKFVGDPTFQWFGWMYLQFINSCLTTNWWRIQSGMDHHAVNLWFLVFVALELDEQAMQDIMLLAHSGIVGRTKANELMWNLLSDWALVDNYQDLSHKVTAEVGKARRTFDRPPVWHDDFLTWSWDDYDYLPAPQWSPLAVPRVQYNLATRDGNKPLPPPWCWAVVAG